VSKQANIKTERIASLPIFSKAFHQIACTFVPDIHMIFVTGVMIVAHFVYLCMYLFIYPLAHVE
jgi:hypothetical protein